MPSRFILVVDSSPVSWQRVSRALPSADGFAMSARSIEEAEAAARAGEIAMVIGSMRVPDGGGYELARRVKLVRPEVRVLLLVDGPERYDPELGAAAGVAGVLDWPCPVDRLRERLHSALADLAEAEAAQAALPEAALPEPALPEPAFLAAGPSGAQDPPPAEDILPEPRRSLFEATAPEISPEDLGPIEELGALEELGSVEPELLEDMPLDAVSLDALENTPIEPIPRPSGPDLGGGRAPGREEAAPQAPWLTPEGRASEPRTAASDERIATFLPRDWKSWPPVRVDLAVVQPAMERAILEVLPEVVDTVLRRLLHTSPALRELVEVAVDEAVRAQVGPIARSVIRERLAEIEAASEDVK